jgi:hypothetical protein
MTPLDPEASAEGRPIFFGAQIVEVVIVRNVERDIFVAMGIIEAGCMGGVSRSGSVGIRK